MNVQWQYAPDLMLYKMVAREDGRICTITTEEVFDSLAAMQRFVEAAREARVRIREHREDDWSEDNA